MPGSAGARGIGRRDAGEQVMMVAEGWAYSQLASGGQADR